ncbi:nucleoporin Nup132 [Schizosaccharomyces japonicus yFS275]|uniref:Nucleoporin Nup132 n=1 Tax=Schizosaccharomyces japonicus (strain yFS275 / FY16936) TaxID=402676 RepID=B6JXR3_SCHJY|nr:nucleoporin Nup132 [Schizosaccharomyces japonicus yFS275]EEB06331.2 nucleoporin Nup132 [Schizosaccharomyces japonicus yFS275]
MSDILKKRKSPIPVNTNRAKRLFLEKHGTTSQKTQFPAFEWIRGERSSVRILLKSLNPKIRNDTGIHGIVDHRSGNVLLISQTACYVFSYTYSPGIDEPPTVVFPLPNDSDAINTQYRPLASFVPAGASTGDTGLLIVLPVSGRIGYWNTIASAAAQYLVRPKGFEAKLALTKNEYCLSLTVAGRCSFVVATNLNRFFLIQVTDATGHPSLSVHLFSGTSEWMTKCLKSLHLLSPKYCAKFLYLKTHEQRHAQESILYAADETGLIDLYDFHPTHPRLIAQMDLRTLFLKTLKEGGASTHDFMVHDLAPVPNKLRRIMVLTSWQKKQHRHYVLYTCDFLDTTKPKIIYIYSLSSYTSTHMEEPKLYIPKPGCFAFCVFEGAAVMLDMQSSASGLNWLHEDPIYIKKNEYGRVIASGSEDIIVDESSGKVLRNPACLLVVQGSGVLRFEANKSSRILDLKNLLKNKIEQAVFYGYLPGVPLDFSLKHYKHLLNGDNGTILLAIGNEIMGSTSSYLPSILPSISHHLGLRVQYLTNLIHYALSMGESADSTTVISIRTMAEKCYAAKSVWMSVDARYTSYSQSLVLSRILLRMTESNDSANATREWFIGHVNEIENLITQAHDYCVDSASRVQEDPFLVLNVILEANEIILAIQASATSFREKMTNLLHIQSSPDGKVEPWTSTRNILSILSKQFELTQSALTQYQHGSVFTDIELQNDKRVELSSALSNMNVQLVALTQVCFDAFSERIAWYKVKGAEFNEEEKSIQEIFHVNRKFWIQTLIDIGKEDSTLRIAEKNLDYRSLVELCFQFHKNSSDFKLEERLSLYIQKFGKDFAFVLYDYCVEKGMLKELLDEKTSHSEYLSEYFAKTDFNVIAWIYDLHQEQYLSAAHRLIALASQKDVSLHKKKVDLCLGKLCYLSEPNTAPLETEMVQIEQNLDFIDIQNYVLKQMKPILRKMKHQGKKRLLIEATIDHVCDNKPIPAIAKQVMQRVLRRLLSNEPVTAIEMIDYLTFSLYRTRIEREEQLDYYLALRLLSYTQLSKATHDFFERTIWRRAMLQDYWPRILDLRNKTDAAIEADIQSSALYQTLELCVVNDLFETRRVHLLQPREWVFKGTAQEVESFYPLALYGNAEEVVKTLNRETANLEKVLDRTQFDEWFQSICASIRLG